MCIYLLASRRIDYRKIVVRCISSCSTENAYNADEKEALFYRAKKKKVDSLKNKNAKRRVKKKNQRNALFYDVTGQSIKLLTVAKFLKYSKQDKNSY